MRAGNGGNGCVAFRREARVPKGGPDGGDGGNGGRVILRIKPGLASLGHLKAKSLLAAEHGEPGMPSCKAGRNGKDCIISVPEGTTVYRLENGTERLVDDLIDPSQSLILAKSGMGGKGNTRFKSAIDRSPVKFTQGSKGEEFEIRLVLRLKADVCLLGYPNSGHSRLLECLTGSSQKVTEYPFSTRTPKMAFLSLSHGHRIYFLDLPSLGKGASQGCGLGSDFLRHAERSRIILLVLSLEGNAEEQMAILLKELREHTEDLLKKKILLIANKIDLRDAPKEWKDLTVAVSRQELPLLGVSCESGQGLEELKEILCRELGCSR